MMRFPNIIRRKLNTEDGTTAIDTIIVLPIFLFLFVSIFELGMATARLTVLEQSLDRTMRDLRLTQQQVIQHDDIRDRICEGASILKDCKSSLLVELTQIKRDDVWTNPNPNATCIDKSAGAVVPANAPTTAGIPNDVVLIRACYVIEPLIPTFGLGAIMDADEDGKLQMVAYSAFAKEPN